MERWWGEPRSGRRRRVRLLLGLLPLLGGALRAQEPVRPFGSLDVTLSAVADVAHGTLHRYWDPGPGVAAGVTTPFHLGRVEVGAQYAHHAGRRAGIPGFHSWFVHAGWGGFHALAPGLAVGGALRIGFYGMRFDGDTIPASRRSESELGVATRAALRQRLSGRWHLEAATTYQAVLTDPRIEQLFLSVGIGRRFGVPPWLRDFLD